MFFTMFNPYGYEPTADQRDIWCYQITLVPRDPVVRAHLDQQPAPSRTLAEVQIVLLDGTVVKPRIFKKNDPIMPGKVLELMTK